MSSFGPRSSVVRNGEHLGRVTTSATYSRARRMFSASHLGVIRGAKIKKPAAGLPAAGFFVGTEAAMPSRDRTRTAGVTSPFQR